MRQNFPFILTRRTKLVFYYTFLLLCIQSCFLLKKIIKMGNKTIVFMHLITRTKAVYACICLSFGHCNCMYTLIRTFTHSLSLWLNQNMYFGKVLITYQPLLFYSCCGLLPCLSVCLKGKQGQEIWKKSHTELALKG